ncbi:MAG: Mini-ribonuclease 3 [Lentilactobacillus diolivorans]|mgnify:CR=1 FL=1|jgi:ribonuclease-3 family protein|uniref:Mini-ribonuclease 3 n=2 Tax=Lentilactobacillus diolivorans TaxID=179838 RepID=A0A0R1S601_9LACO|nr:Mini-ribonuclease 3 [Lentilactobacillus diolivorans]RRG01377.1 MAG: Mini-ribonuclease 3 [Lactobacillus sp.]KRL64383.1 ribonuclease III [Lentilactobacillus diolivorans DSM 14421]MCH4164274.1 Mini-ribonuclease 3 [Lentilactobacillus diolivorans]MDH5105753.1 Mini-ribonuclease 3 [Lentilactobacillus diolivorans]GEP23124.1 mini-ribonuclease 3 [Lentilactobacillus diolivorans]
MTNNFTQLNGIALAYMGDAAYEVFIRRHLINQGLTKPTRLQHAATNYVSAKAQAALIDLMKQNDLLNDEEWEYFKRGRNAKSHTHAKNTDVITYRISTGFEAVFGYLSLSDQTDRMIEIANWCINQVESGNLKHEE